jgi:hypothetical protein
MQSKRTQVAGRALLRAGLALVASWIRDGKFPG